MTNYLKKLQKYLKKQGIVVTESTISMVLGALVVIVVSIFAYNYFKSTRVPVTPAASTIAEEVQGEIATGKTSTALPTVHVVQAGETLWSIAEKYYNSGFNYHEIAQVNRLENASNIEVGQKLVIPNAPIQAVTTSSETVPVITQSRIEGATYTILAGDDLWEIAVRAYGDGYKWVEIAKANNLSDPNLIHAGNPLTIPRN